MNELLAAVLDALSTTSSHCIAADASEDGVVTIGETVEAVRHALEGCPS